MVVRAAFGATFALAVGGLLVGAAGCASPMHNMRTENRQLTHTVDELRGDRRIKNAKIKELENELMILKDKVETNELARGRGADALPQLPVEVMGPTAQADDLTMTSEGAERVVGVTEDGTEIVYVDDAAMGKNIKIPRDAISNGGDDKTTTTLQ